MDAIVSSIQASSSFCCNSSSHRPIVFQAVVSFGLHFSTKLDLMMKLPTNQLGVSDLHFRFVVRARKSGLLSVTQNDIAFALGVSYDCSLLWELLGERV